MNEAKTIDCRRSQDFWPMSGNGFKLKLLAIYLKTVNFFEILLMEWLPYIFWWISNDVEYSNFRELQASTNVEHPVKPSVYGTE